MIKLKYVLSMIMLMVILASCAPIDGLGGAEDNLPDMSQDEVVEEPIAPVEEISEEVAVPEEEVSVIPEIEPAEVNYVRIDADALNVRSDASIDAERLTKVYDLQIYEVLGEKKDLADHTWYKIEAADGISGWVSSDYCIGGVTYNELMVESE